MHLSFTIDVKQTGVFFSQLTKTTLRIKILHTVVPLTSWNQIGNTSLSWRDLRCKKNFASTTTMVRRRRTVWPFHDLREGKGSFSQQCPLWGCGRSNSSSSTLWQVGVCSCPPPLPPPNIPQASVGVGLPRHSFLKILLLLHAHNKNYARVYVSVIWFHSPLWNFYYGAEILAWWTFFFGMGELTGHIELVVMKCHIKMIQPMQNHFILLQYCSLSL